MEAMLSKTMLAEDRERLFTALYKTTFPAVARYISQMGGSLDEAKDVFHDALVLYYERCLREENPPQQEKAYVLGIVKHLWSKQFQEKIRYTSLDPLPEEKEPLSAKAETPSTEKLLRFLEKAGEKCMQLLSAFYYEKLPPEVLAGKFGFSGVRSATVQKYKCLEKVRDTVKQKSLQYEDFLD